MNEVEQQMWIANQARKEEEVRRAERYRDESKHRLARVLEKKLKTSFIGPLAKFEMFFGHLWGHHKKDSDRTDNERQWLEIWQQCRHEILNNGNNQLRAVQAELLQYDIAWSRFQAVLLAKNG